LGVPAKVNPIAWCRSRYLEIRRKKYSKKNIFRLSIKKKLNIKVIWLAEQF